MSTITTTNTPNSGSKSTEDQASRYQQLKLRKDALEKKLNEKYELLHQICQKVSHLIDVDHFQEIHSSFLCLFLGGFAYWQQSRSHIDKLSRVGIATGYTSEQKTRQQL